jgi:hypothetical protein
VNQEFTGINWQSWNPVARNSLVEVERISLWRKSHVERIKWKRNSLVTDCEPSIIPKWSLWRKSSLEMIDNQDCEPWIYWDKLTELKSSSDP